MEKAESAESLSGKEKIFQKAGAQIRRADANLSAHC
jgi:hypothetical protein